VLVYIPATSIRASLGLIRSIAVDVIVEGIDDAPQTFRQSLFEANGDVCAATIAALEPRLSTLPALIRARIRRVVMAPNEITTVGSLSDAVDVPVRTLDRHLMRACLPSPKAFVRFIRVVRAFALLRKPHAECERVAQSLGYSSGRRLSLDMRLIVGRPAAAARRTFTPSEFVRRALLFIERTAEQRRDSYNRNRCRPVA
jgi:transcriptional regulator GlxA family with amidase domain